MKIGFDAKRLYSNMSGLGNYSRTLLRNLSSYLPANDYVLYTTKITLNKETNSFLEDSGYTTTLKLMQIMTEKGLTQRDTSSRTHIYTAVATEEKTKINLVKMFIQSTFGGSATSLVLSALGSEKTSAKDLEEIKSLISKIENEK